MISFRRHAVTSLFSATLILPQLTWSQPIASNPIAQTAVVSVASMAELFPLRAIKLLAGPVGDQQELNRHYLLKLDPDRLLSWFRKEAGLVPKAPPYRGWESETPLLPGHILGFYLSGAAMTVQATGDATLSNRLNYIVAELTEVQAAHRSGYMLAVPDGKKLFAEVAHGQIKIGGLPWTGNSINGQFEPTYTLNKLMLGLDQVCQATQNAKAREVLIRLADWFGHDVLDKLDDQQVQTLLECEHGSLNESFADVYALTGDKKYLRWARRLCHERMMLPLAKNDGVFLTHIHANTQIPKFTGFERISQFNGEAQLDAAAMNFWSEVVDHRSWVIGGNSVDEHFFPTKDFGKELSNLTGPESCNSVNMLQLTEALFRAHPSAKLMDYYERTLFNHLLAAHEPERGMFVYFTSMRPGAYRVYSDEFDSMWCCVGTGMEAPGKYGQMIYSQTPDHHVLDVNLFIASELTWQDQGVCVRQTTAFPDEAATTLAFSSAKAQTQFTLRLRHPWWVPDGQLKLEVNGRAITNHSRRGEYAAVERAWNSGDVVRIALPMRLTTEIVPGDDHYVAVLYGPVVLSGALGREGLTKYDFWQIKDNVARKTIPEAHAPVFVAATPDEIVARIKPVAGKPLTFYTSGLARPLDVELIPFFRNHFQRYALYWHRLSPDEYYRVREGKDE